MNNRSSSPSLIDSIVDKFDNVTKFINSFVETSKTEVSSGIKQMLRKDFVTYEYKLGHKFKPMPLPSPTCCSQCQEFIIGFLAQSCASCGLVSHRNCLNKVNSICLAHPLPNQYEEQDTTIHDNYAITSHQHQLEETFFVKPAFCKHCGELITYIGRKGVVCRICELKFHNKCLKYTRGYQCNDQKFHQKQQQQLSINNHNNNCLIQINQEQHLNITFRDFQPIRLLGRGASSKVLLAELRNTQTKYAIKIVKKTNQIVLNEPKSVLDEMRVLSIARNHPFLGKLHCCFQSTNRLYFVTEYIEGRDLFYYIFLDNNMRGSKFGEERTKFHASEIFLALDYLHKNRILHRDLKLENVILNKRGHCKLVDFGISKELGGDDSMFSGTFCGTPRYISPEMIRGNMYNGSIDLWAFGVMIYEMLLGISPFASAGQEDDDIYKRVLEEDPMENFPKSFSRQAEDLLRNLFVKDPNERISNRGIMKHEFFKFNSKYQWKEIEQQTLQVPYLPNLSSNTLFSSSSSPSSSSSFISTSTLLEGCDRKSLEFTPIDKEDLKKIPQEEFRHFTYSSESFNKFLPVF